VLDDDALIMQRVQAGDLDRFSDLIRRYQRPLHRAALERLGDPTWAEDVVQEAFLAAFAGRQSYNSAFSFRTWLWTILINLCKRHWKRRATRPAPQSWSELPNDRIMTSSEPHTQATGLTCLIHEERLERIRELLMALPEDQADALRLRFFGGLAFPEIAAALGCSLNTAKSRVRYGLEKIGRTLRSEEESNP
jgi:RNA polymerase sigma-70 factor (ECF subfamily)